MRHGDIMRAHQDNLEKLHDIIENINKDHRGREYLMFSNKYLQHLISCGWVILEIEYELNDGSVNRLHGDVVMFNTKSPIILIIECKRYTRIKARYDHVKKQAIDKTMRIAAWLRYVCCFDKLLCERWDTLYIEACIASDECIESIEDSRQKIIATTQVCKDYFVSGKERQKLALVFKRLCDGMLDDDNKLKGRHTSLLQMIIENGEGRLLSQERMKNNDLKIIAYDYAIPSSCVGKVLALSKSENILYVFEYSFEDANIVCCILSSWMTYITKHDCRFGRLSTFVVKNGAAGICIKKKIITKNLIYEGLQSVPHDNLETP